MCTARYKKESYNGTEIADIGLSPFYLCTTAGACIINEHTPYAKRQDTQERGLQAESKDEVAWEALTGARTHARMALGVMASVRME